MHEAMHPATDQEHTPSAPQPSRAQSPLQRTIDPHHLARYGQLMGQRLPAGLRLSPSPFGTAQPPVQRQVEEAIQQEPSLASRREEGRAQLLWGNQVPPHLRLPLFPPREQQAVQEPAEPLLRKENTTGLPDALKAGVEHLSGLSLEDVQVHYNSSRPAEVQALAYTQGTEIYVGPGQAQHLPHEAWHVVQQKQGNVQPTTHMQERAINNDEVLEQEATVMGMHAYQLGQRTSQTPSLQGASSQAADFTLPSPARGNQRHILQKYQLRPTEVKEFEREIKDRWKIEPESDAGREFIAWCSSYDQARTLMANFTHADFLDYRQLLTDNLYPAKALGQTKNSIDTFVNTLTRIPPLPDNRSPDAIYQALMNTWDATEILAGLLRRILISRGNIVATYRSKEYDRENKHEFSVCISIVGMPQREIHVHCSQDGKVNTTNGDNPAHIKLVTDRYGKGGQKIKRGGTLQDLIPSVGDREQAGKVAGLVP